MSQKRKRDDYPLRNRKGKGLKLGSLSTDILSVIVKFLRPIEYRAVLLTCRQWLCVGKKQLIPHFYRNHFGEVNNITPDEMKKRFYYHRNIIQKKNSLLVYDDMELMSSWDDIKINIVMDDEKVFLYKQGLQYFKLIHNDRVKKFPLEGSKNGFMNFHFNRDYMAGVESGKMKIWNSDGRLLREHDCLLRYTLCEERLKIWDSDVCYGDDGKIKVCDIRSRVRREIGPLSNTKKILFENNMIYTNCNGHLKIYDLRKPEKDIYHLSFIMGYYDFGLYHGRLYMPYGGCIMEFDKKKFVNAGQNNYHEMCGYDINVGLELENHIYEKVISYDDMFICNLYQDPDKLHFIDLRNKRIYRTMNVPRFESIACSNARVAYSYKGEKGRRRMEIMDFS